MAGDTGCIEYSGTRDRLGYGILPKPVHGSRLAARAVLAAKLGRPVSGVTRHTCDNPPCVNPDHLVEGSVADNSRDMKARGRGRGRFSGVTACKYGHPLDDPTNVRVKTYSDGRVERMCLTCFHRRNTEQAARRKAARARRKTNV